MFQFGKCPMDILEMLSGHQAHQFKGLGLQHQQQVQLQHPQQLQHQQQQGEASGALLSGLGLGSLQGSRSNAFSDSSIFAKMSAPLPPIPQQTQSASSQSSRKSSKMSSGSGSTGASGYPQFLRPFHPAEAALAQEQLHSGMGRFDFAGGSGTSGSGVIGGVVTSAPPPPPLHPGLSVPQPSPGPPSSSPSPSSSTTTSNNPASSSSTVAGLVGSQSDARSLHQQFSCMLAANQYFLSGMPANASLEQFLVQQGPHNPLGLSESNIGLAPPPALHPSHTHGHPASQPQQQQQQLAPHALSHPHSHAHPHHPLHTAPQPSPLSGFDFQGIPVLSSNQLASLMQQEAGLPLTLPLHLSAPKDDGKGDGGSGAGGGGGSGSRRKKAMAGYLPQRKTDGSSSGSSSSTNCHSSSGAHGHDGSSGLVGGGSGVGMRGLAGDPSSILTPSTPSSSSSSTVSSSSSSAPSSNSASVLVSNVSQMPKTDNQSAMTPTVSEPEPVFHCGECGKSFTHINSLRRHIRNHDDHNGPNASANANPNTVHQHQSDTSLPHSTQDRISHQHEPNQSNPDLSSSSCESPDKTYCCNECGKGFKKRGHLLQHGVIHSGARPFACSTCQRSFNRRESLTRHEKIHEDKPYRCPVCDRCFRESTSLLNHASSGSCGKPGRGSSGSSDGSSSVSSDDKVEGSEYQGRQLPDDKALVYQKTEGGATEIPCDALYPQGRAGNPHSADKTEGKYNSPYSRDPYQTSYRVDDYRRPQGNLPYSGDGSCNNGLSGPALRKAPLAPTLHPHPSSQQQQQHHHQQQPHLPLSALLDDSEDEVTSSAMSAIAAAAAASVLPPEMNNNGGREERRDIIGGLLGGLGFGTIGGPSSTSTGTGGNDECLSGSMMPLSHPTQQQPTTQNATPNAKPKRPRKPRQKREPRPGGLPGEGVKRRRSQNGPRGEGSERPYLCTVCGRGFGRRETLRRHERVHTGEKPFHCDVCGKDFREPFHLTKHQTVHSGEKNYKCSLCGKDFGYAQSLKRHEKLHLRGDFKPRRSKTKSSTNQASQDGSQTNPGSYYPYPQDKAQGSSAGASNQPPPKLYTCQICWKTFRHHFQLTAHHQAIHEQGGEKLFSCEVCGKAFAYSNSLTRHRLSQHGLTRTVPTTQPTGGGSGGNSATLEESEAATNTLLNLTPDSGGHNVQQTHSTISHTQIHSQPAGYSPLFYTPESGPHNSNTSAPPHSQHPHYPHSTVAPLSHQQPIGGKVQQIYTGVTANPLHPAPPHIHISSSSHPQYHQQQPQQQQQHSFQMQHQQMQHQVGQVHADVAQKKKEKKKKNVRFVHDGQVTSGFGGVQNTRWDRFLMRKKLLLQQQLKRKRWISQLNWARYTAGIGINVGNGIWRAGRLKFRGLRSFMVPFRFFPCPICPSTNFTRRLTLSVHRVIRHPPRKHGCRARLRCVVCGKRSRRLLSALRHRARHLSQGYFSCPQCPSRFWNGTLLQRHRFVCQRFGGAQKTPKGTYSKKEEYFIERSAGMVEYRH
ncbi:zinc finger protein 865 [Trichomycterus rosablanca]|uniref:zinc finger protein 865 n=1 Tax=Trichomycterus rosablanca TaxID=2290929 RepID=UPI002F35C944